MQNSMIFQEYMFRGGERDWGFSSVVEHLPSKRKALCLFLSSEGKKNLMVFWGRTLAQPTLLQTPWVGKAYGLAAVGLEGCTFFHLGLAEQLGLGSPTSILCLVFLL